MRIFAFAVAAAFLLIAPSAFAQSDIKGEIEAAKEKLNAAFANDDVDTIKAMVTDDHIGVSTYYGKAFTTAEEIATLDAFKVEAAEFGPSTITPLGPEAAMITYENTYQGTFEGKPLPSRVFVSEIWVKQDGNWLQKLYQETPIEP